MHALRSIGSLCAVSVPALKPRFDGALARGCRIEPGEAHAERRFIREHEHPWALSDWTGHVLDISDLERKLDDQLVRPRLRGSPSPALLDAAKRWSEAVWARAQTAGPLPISNDETEIALRLSRRPVFVCGVHRSGTSLLRDLLDGHPALAVLPSEGTFLTSFEPRLRRLDPDRWLPLMGQEWLRRLANPNNQSPYWTLGSPSHATCPYLKFARALLAWWPTARTHLSESAASWPLVAVMLAYVHATDGFAISRLQRWVEKTPTNERFIARLLAEFPAARIIHVLRHPADVYMSRRAAEAKRVVPLRNQWRMLADLERTYRIAARHPSDALSNQIIVMRYEDVVADVAQSMKQVAEFLDIEPLPILQQPTVAGQPSMSNSSLAVESPPGQVLTRRASTASRTLPRADIERIAAVIGTSAAPFGYDLAAGGRLRTSLMRFTARMLIGRGAP